MSSEDVITIRKPVYELHELNDEDLEKSVQIDKNFFLAKYAKDRQPPQCKQVPIVHTRSDGTVFDGTIEVILVNSYGDRRVASSLRMFQIMFGRVPGAQFYYDLKHLFGDGYRKLTEFEEEGYPTNSSFERLIQAVNYPPDRAQRYIDEFDHFKSVGGFKKASDSLDDADRARQLEDTITSTFEIVFHACRDIHMRYPNLSEKAAHMRYELARKIKDITSHDLERADDERSGKRARGNVAMAIGFPRSLSEFTTCPSFHSGVTALADSLDVCSIEADLEMVKAQAAACSLDGKSPNLTDD